MATRLTDIITVFQDKWNFGDVKFGYEGEVNQDHDTQYPLMLIEPPSSIMPQVYNSREEYEFEINFYNLYSQAAQSAVVLQQRWDNLQDLANTWLDMVLKFYQDAGVNAYLNDESITIERVKEVANDRLVQITFSFTLTGFTKCFRPVSNYPSDYGNLRLWLTAANAGTFDLATKTLTSWTDRSGNGFNASQSTEANKPLRIGYGGAKDKTYIEFDGSTDFMSISSGLLTSTSSTTFIVFKQDDYTAGTTETIFNINGSGSEELKIYCLNGTVYVSVTDSGGDTVTISTLGNTTNWNLLELRIDEANSISVILNGSEVVPSMGNYNQTTFNSNVSLGSANSSGSSFSEYFDGRIEEVIVYDEALSTSLTTQSDIRGYLTEKYGLTSVTTMTNNFSVSFDGASSYMSCGDKDIFSINNSGLNNGFSISFWYKPAATAANQAIISKNRFSGQFEWAINSNTASKMRFRIYGNNNLNIWQQLTISTPFSSSAWSHVVFTYDLGTTNSSFKAYVNGVLKSHGSGANYVSKNIGSFISSYNTICPLFFGREGGNWGQCQLDEISIWDNVLSQGQVTSIYNSGSPTDLSAFTDLLGWWRNGDPDGTTSFPTITDDSTNSNFATMINMTATDITTDAP